MESNIWHSGKDIGLVYNQPFFLHFSRIHFDVAKWTVAPENFSYVFVRVRQPDAVFH